MCGICGFVNPSGIRRPMDEERLIRMRDVMRHRGPDAEGLYLDETVALGHRRLSIVDPEHGHQPMGTADGRFQLVFNGEIYNHPELRKGLRLRGTDFRTHCDSETLLELLASDGPAAISRLRGMFAFALWDRRQRTLLLARDPFGIKPLYYVSDGSALFFSSEIKGLIAAGAVVPRMNRSTLPDLLANHAPSGEDTLFDGVKRLLPGCSLTWRDGGIQIEQYWDVPQRVETPFALNDGEAIERYRELLYDAVRSHLMADVPLGVFLSGGIDSAAITAVASQLVQDPVQTFSVAFEEREANELDFARLVAERYRTTHREVVIDPDQFASVLPRMIWHEDEPIAHPSSIPLFFVSELAARHVKVVLTGEGADETMAGYGRYKITRANLALGRQYTRRVPARARRLVSAAISAMPRTSGWRRRLRRTFLHLPADLEHLYFENFAVFGRERQHQLFRPEVLESLPDPYAIIQEHMAARDPAALLDSLLYADMKTYLHELLMKQDQMSMAASLESRVPFLDGPLVDYVVGLPDRLKLSGWRTKVILREAVKDLLPPEILTRKKMGFPVPIGRWFRGRHRGLIREFCESPRARDRGLFEASAVDQLIAEHMQRHDRHSERLWTLVNLEIWSRLFEDGESVEDVTDCLTRC